eukprot:CAMPEP_0184413102 /NCGR_PEP_ID=MMETSP0738-20130409/6997_1 /TAXON_ID=385413 /ORGANISM="Thalassiosira miniscula, Strain CCMP1093" /LENGTH=113 /DNA_ID=CAMNT_0026771779 /DNA_START=187 /DNA_END=525 /DNA_ORIENTATION=+
MTNADNPNSCLHISTVSLIAAMVNNSRTYNGTRSISQRYTSNTLFFRALLGGFDFWIRLFFCNVNRPNRLSALALTASKLTPPSNSPGRRRTLGIGRDATQVTGRSWTSSNFF